MKQSCAGTYVGRRSTDKRVTLYAKQKSRFWGISSAGRAPALQAGGQGFESLILHNATEHWLPGSSRRRQVRFCRTFANSLDAKYLGGALGSTPNGCANISGCSAVGSAPALGAGGRRFEPCHPDRRLNGM